jgi:beta-lactam-binding protein with PASTA domain
VTIFLVLLGGTGVGVAWKLGYFSKSSPVPSLVGLSQQQAMTLLTPSGLSLRVTGSEASASIAAGSILSQTPVAGTTLKQGSVVSVVVSGGQVLVPLPSNITGVDCATATSALVSIGISAQCPVSLEETSTIFAQGHVIAVLYHGKRNPAQVPGGATVDLIVSLGAHAPASTTTLPGTTTTKPVTTTTKPGTTTTKPVTTTTKPVTTTTVNPHGPRAVPHLVGLSRAATFAAMKSAEFYFATHGPGSANGTWTKVVAQSPAPGTMLRWHGTVTLQVK